MYVIVGKDYEYPLFSSFYVFDHKTFLHQEEAERYLEDSKTLSRFTKSMLKVVPVPSCQEWRFNKTLHPFQLYPIGTMVKVLPGILSPNEILSSIESHIDPETPVEVRSSLLRTLYSLYGGRTELSLATHDIVEPPVRIEGLSDTSRKVSGYTVKKGYLLQGLSGFVNTHQLLPFKNHLFGELSISSPNSLQQLFLC